MLQKFKTLVDLLTYFDSEQVCRDYLEAIRWGTDLKCAYKDCDGDKVFKFGNGKVYKCAKCKRQYSVRVGTIFEDSKISLAKWYAAIYLITSHKKGISSLQLHRDLGVTQKTGWYMLHRVRHSLGLQQEEKLTGTIEADETFMGGKEGNKHKSKRIEASQGRSSAKTPVAGLIERGGNLIAKQVPDTSGKSLRPFILANVTQGSNLNTDEWFGYNGLKAVYNHNIISHSENEYVRNSIHTQSIEGFWSLLKRSVYGIYHSVSNKHLQQYVNESVFRYNTRKQSENERFNYMLSNLKTHITLKQLTNKDDNGRAIATPDRQMEGEQGFLSF